MSHDFCQIHEACVVDRMLADDLELLQARYEACYLALVNLVGLVRRENGFMYPADQQILRDAQCVLAEGVTR